MVTGRGAQPAIPLTQGQAITTVAIRRWAQAAIAHHRVLQYLHLVQFIVCLIQISIAAIQEWTVPLCRPLLPGTRTKQRRRTTAARPEWTITKRATARATSKEQQLRQVLQTRGELALPPPLKTVSSDRHGFIAGSYCKVLCYWFSFCSQLCRFAIVLPLFQETKSA